jgi:hypothetical protein
VAAAWYQRLVGGPPSFLPNDTEAVWEVADHCYVYITMQPEHAGHAMHIRFVTDFAARMTQIAERGLEPLKARPTPTACARYLPRPGRQRDRVRRRTGDVAHLAGRACSPADSGSRRRGPKLVILTAAASLAALAPAGTAAAAGAAGAARTGRFTRQRTQLAARLYSVAATSAKDVWAVG